MTWSPDPSLLEPCATCGKVDCKCEPPAITIDHEDSGRWDCENCGRTLVEGDRAQLWDDGPVTHVECPKGAQA